MRNPAVLLLLSLTFIIFSGCLSSGGDQVTGTWGWSDGKGYTEYYTFLENHSFYAEGLGSRFSGSWKQDSPGHYTVTYWNVNDTGRNETLSERAVYDETTGAVYFPAHVRVLPGEKSGK